MFDQVSPSLGPSLGPILGLSLCPSPSLGPSPSPGPSPSLGGRGKGFKGEGSDAVLAVSHVMCDVKWYIR